MKYLCLMVLSVISFQNQARATDPDTAVESRKNFEPGKHGTLLASYLNYLPFAGPGVGKAATRQDDSFGVCRVFADGEVITSTNLGGAAQIRKAKIVSDKVLINFKSLMTKDGTLGEKPYPPFGEGLYIHNTADGESMYSTITPDSALSGPQFRIDPASSLAQRLREICPLDNEPAHLHLVKKN